MARMIPSFIDPDSPSGERDLFNLLASGPADWTVLHSLDISPWNRGKRTEIDFVAIVPEQGILCLEVKSHDRISFDGERWHPPDLRRSPFKQAVDASSTFHRALKEQAPQFSHVPVVHCCVFPNATFDLPPILSIKPWEIMDSTSFRSFRSAASFCTDLRQRIDQSIKADARLHAMREKLSPDHIEVLIRCCVPVHKRRPEAREEIKRRAEAAEAILHQQQRPILRLIEENPRVLVSGGAGTGKTLISMEVARRVAEKGYRTALLCFNQLIGDWMKERVRAMKPEVPGLVVGRAIRVMAEMAEIDVPSTASRDFWDVGLPDMLEARLSDPDFKVSAAFDYLVLDEAQDILSRPRLWDCLKSFLSGGIEKGTFTLFGDFANQVLGERVPMERTLAALHTAARPASWKLSENCRNYAIVGQTAVRLSGINPDTYSAYLRPGGSVHDYEISFYSERRTQLERMKQWLREFREMGYRPSEITLLSFRDAESSAAVELIRDGYKLRPAWQGGDSTGYTSVSAFKGMENKVIILTDVAPREQGFYRELFYTGMTRATESVRVSCDMSSQQVLLNWFTGAALS